MGSVDTESLSSLFLLPDTIAIEAVYPTKAHLTVQVACVLKSAACPLCQHSSARIHGSYGRRVADVPCGGRRVTLALTVRKFVCRTLECPRKIFDSTPPSLGSVLCSYDQSALGSPPDPWLCHLWGSGRTTGSQTRNGYLGSDASSPHASYVHSPSRLSAHFGH